MAGFLNYQSMALLVIGAFLFYGMYNWTAEYMETTDERTEEQRQDLVKCTELDVDFVDREITNSSTTIFFTVNRPVEALKITFRGKNNASKVVRDVVKNSIYTTTVNITGVRQVGAVAKECSELPN